MPERKGPFPSYNYLKDFLLEVFKHEKCFVTVLTVYPDGDIDTQDGPQWMHIFYPRNKKAASKYLEKLNAEDEFREVREADGEIIKGTVEPGLAIEGPPKK